MKECSNCGASNPDQNRFCAKCGESLVLSVVDRENRSSAVTCPNCGSDVPEGFQFCGKCGTEVPQKGNRRQGGAVKSAARPKRQKSPTTTSSSEVIGKLVVVQPDGTKGPSVSIERGETTIGRSSSDDALSKDPFLSPEHAVLSFQNNEFVVRDISELNGIFVRITDAVELRHGDSLRIGQQLLRFELTSRAAPFRRIRQNEETKLRGSSLEGDQPWGRLSLINGPDTRTEAFGLKQKSTRIGREFGDIIFDDDGFISGEHAEISKNNDRIELKDLGSSNGTYLRIRESRRLHHNDLILMGQQLFQVQLT